MTCKPSGPPAGTATLQGTSTVCCK
jgi:hypothetical protein